MRTCSLNKVKLPASLPIPQRFRWWRCCLWSFRSPEVPRKWFAGHQKRLSRTGAGNPPWTGFSTSRSRQIPRSQWRCPAFRLRERSPRRRVPGRRPAWRRIRPRPASASPPPRFYLPALRAVLCDEPPASVFAPAWLNCHASSSPIPEEAPVIRTTLSRKNALVASMVVSYAERVGVV